MSICTSQENQSQSCDYFQVVLVSLHFTSSVSTGKTLASRTPVEQANLTRFMISQPAMNACQNYQPTIISEEAQPRLVDDGVMALALLPSAVKMKNSLQGRFDCAVCTESGIFCVFAAFRNFNNSIIKQVEEKSTEKRTGTHARSQSSKGTKALLPHQEKRNTDPVHGVYQ